MEFKVVDDVNISKEELDYYDNHDFGKEFAEGLKDGSTIVSEGPWEDTVRMIRERRAAERARNASQVVTMRMSSSLVERYKRRAAAAGIGYQTLMKEILEAAPV